MKTLAFLIYEIDNSKELIRFAALLGKDIKARIDVLHIQSPQFFGAQGYTGVAGATIPTDPNLFQKMTSEVTERAVGYIKEIEAELPGISSINLISEIGEESVILKEKVENKTYDMVMLQGQAEQGFLVQTSAIMDVVRNVPCPVWIIPPGARYKPLKKVIYATDYNEEDIRTLKSLIDLTKSSEPEIMSLHISNDDEFEKKLISEGFAEVLGEKTGYNNVSVKMIVEKEGEDAVETLISEAEKAKADLIVVLKENRGFFERIFKSSFTIDLIKKVQLPVLVYQERKQ